MGIHARLDQDVTVGDDSYVAAGGKGIQGEGGKIQGPVRSDRTAAPNQLLLLHRHVFPVGDLFELDHRDVTKPGLVARPLVHDVVCLGEHPVGDVSADVLDGIPLGLQLVDVIGLGFCFYYRIGPMGLYLVEGGQQGVRRGIVPVAGIPHHQVVLIIQVVGLVGIEMVVFASRPGDRIRTDPLEG